MKKFNIDNIYTDPTLEREGVWHDTGTSLKLLIAKSGNTEYLAELRRQMLAAGDNDTLDGTSDEDAIINALATHVLKDWQGMYRSATKEEIAEYRAKNCAQVDENGEDTQVAEWDELIEVVYSPENAVYMLKAVPELYRLVMRLSNDTARFKASTIIAQAKESPL